MEEKKSFSTGRKPLKGAVLFTVLSVMMVILILMLTTVGLSSVASKRAYSEYYDAQIAATGRSVISTVLESLEPTSGNNKALGKTIYTEVSNNGSYEVYLENGGNLGQGLGRVDKIEFSKAGVDDVGDFFVNGSSYMIMKVTATITMGNKTTTYTEYVSDMVHFPGKNGGNGGLLSTNGADSSGTGMAILGPFGGGFKNYVKKSGTDVLTLANNGAYVGPSFFNQSVKINTYKTFVFDTNSAAASYDINDLTKADYQGITLLGDLIVENNSAPFVSKTLTTDAQSTPYLFLTGKLDCSAATSVMIGSLGSQNAIADAKQSDLIKQTSGNKVNVYCGSFELPKNKIKIASNIYCYDDNQTSILGGDMNDTPLLTWAEEQISTGTLKDGNSIIGDIFTKGNLKLSQTKIAVKGNVYVEKVLDLSDINKSSQQIPDIAGGKIYCKAVIPADYTNVDGASDQYKNLLTKIEVVTNNNFPADMELDKILGITFNAGVGTDGSSQLSAINTGNYSLSGAIDFSKKIIQNPLEMKTKFYQQDPSDSSKWILRNSYSQSGVTHTAKVYTNSGHEPGTEAVPSVITEQCTIRGDIWGKQIVIKPKPKTANEELWITLDDVSLLTLGSTTSEIIVENEVDDGTGNMVEAGPVCFYVADGTSLNLKTGARIVTRYYADNYLDSISNHNKVKNPLSINNGSMSNEYIPNIYIYGSNKEDEITAEDQREVLNFENYSMVTAYIVAPRAALTIGEMGDKGAQITYEGVDYKDIRVGIIGSAIVGPIRDAKNNVTLLYVDNSDGSAPVPAHDYFGYHPLQGFTNY